MGGASSGGVDGDERNATWRAYTGKLQEWQRGPVKKWNGAGNCRCRTVSLPRRCFLEKQTARSLFLLPALETAFEAEGPAGRRLVGLCCLSEPGGEDRTAGKRGPCGASPDHGPGRCSRQCRAIGGQFGAAVGRVSTRSIPSSRGNLARWGDFTAVLIRCEHNFSARFAKNNLTATFFVMTDFCPLEAHPLP